MSQIYLNDKIKIISTNPDFNEIEGFITFLSDEYLRIYADDGSDIVIPLKPYDENFGIQRLDILARGSSESIIEQNGIVKGKFVYFRKKGSSQILYGYIRNIEDNNVTLIDLTEIEGTAININLENGFHPDLPIYYIFYKPSSDIPINIKNRVYKIDLEKEIGEIDEKDVDLEVEIDEGELFEEIDFNIEDEFQEEIDEKNIIYNDTVQINDMVDDLLVYNENQEDAIKHAQNIIYIKNQKLVYDQNNFGVKPLLLGKDYKPYIDSYEKNGIHGLPNWIYPVVKNKRILYEIPNQDDDNNTPEFLETDQHKNENVVEFLTKMNDPLTNIKHRVLEKREDNQENHPNGKTILFRNPDDTLALHDEAMHKYPFYSLKTNEPISVNSFIVRYQQSLNYKLSEYSSLYEIVKRSERITGEFHSPHNNISDYPYENDAIHVPFNKKDDYNIIQQNRILVSDVEKNKNYIFCIQESELGRPRGLIMSGKVKKILDDEFHIEPINPDLKRKVPLLKLYLDGLEVYEYNVEHNVQCIFEIMRNITESKDINDLLASVDIYLRMEPVNTYTVVNSKDIFQFLQLMGYTRRNLHYHHYRLFRKILKNNIDNFMEGLLPDITDTIYQAGSESKYPIIETPLFNNEILNSEVIRKHYPQLKFYNKPSEYLLFLENTNTELFTNLHSLKYHTEILKFLQDIYSNKKGERANLKSEKQRLEQEIRELESNIKDQLKDKVKIVKQYNSLKKLRDDEKKEFILIGKDYDDTNRDLFSTIRQNNPSALYDDHIKMLVSRLEKIYNRKPTNEETMAHINGGKYLNIGDKVLLKEKNVIQVYEYKGKDVPFELVIEELYQPQNDFERALYGGENKITNMTLQSLTDESQKIIHENKVITKNLQQLETELQYLNDMNINEDTLEEYSNIIKNIQSRIEYSKSILELKNKKDSREYVVPDSLLNPTDTPTFYITQMEKMAVYDESFDTEVEFTRGGELKVRRVLMESEEIPDLPYTSLARKYMFFMEVIGEIFEVNIRKEDIEQGYSWANLIIQRIPREARKKQRIYNAYLVAIFGATLVLIFQTAIPEYMVNGKIGRTSFTQRGYPLDQVEELEEDKSEEYGRPEEKTETGIIQSIAGFLSEMKIQLNEKNQDVGEIFEFKRQKPKVFNSFITDYVNNILDINISIWKKLETKREYLRSRKSVIYSFNPKPIGIENDEEVPVMDDVEDFGNLLEGFDGINRINRDDYARNEMNIFRNKERILKDAVKDYDPILITSHGIPYINNAINPYHYNIKSNIYERLGRTGILLDIIRKNSLMNRYPMNTIYSIKPMMIIKEGSSDINYRVNINLVKKIAIKSFPEMVDLKDSDYTREFFQELVRTLRLRNLLPDSIMNLWDTLPQGIKDIYNNNPLIITPESNIKRVDNDNINEDDIYMGGEEEGKSEDEEDLDTFDQLMGVLRVESEDYDKLNRFRVMFIDRDESMEPITDILTSVINVIFYVYIPRVINGKDMTNVKDHVYKNKNLSSQHIEQIEKILEGRSIERLYSITSSLHNNKKKDRAIKKLVRVFRKIRIPTLFNINDFMMRLKRILERMDMEDDIDIFNITRNLIVEGLVLVPDIYNLISESRESLEEFMSSIIERERNMIISQDDRLKNDQDKRELNQVQKNLKLGIWALGARKGWDYSAELYDLEAKQLAEWEALREERYGIRDDGERPVDAGQLTVGMMEERERAEEDARIEREDVGMDIIDEYGEDQNFAGD
jgi:hypothetical protein